MGPSHRPPEQPRNVKDQKRYAYVKTKVDDVISNNVAGTQQLVELERKKHAPSCWVPTHEFGGRRSHKARVDDVVEIVKMKRAVETGKIRDSGQHDDCRKDAERKMPSEENSHTSWLPASEIVPVLGKVSLNSKSGLAFSFLLQYNMFWCSMIHNAAELVNGNLTFESYNEWKGI